MQSFKYNFFIQANSEKEADVKMQSLTAIASRLTANELEKLAHVVKNEPAKLAMAKAALGV